MLEESAPTGCLLPSFFFICSLFSCLCFCCGVVAMSHCLVVVVVVAVVVVTFVPNGKGKKKCRKERKRKRSMRRPHCAKKKKGQSVRKEALGSAKCSCGEENKECISRFSFFPLLMSKSGVVEGNDKRGTKLRVPALLLLNRSRARPACSALTRQANTQLSFFKKKKEDASTGKRKATPFYCC